MRQITRSFTLALALVVLSSSLPAFAIEKQVKDGPRERPNPVQIVKRIMKRIIGGIVSNDEITGPRPIITNDGITGPRP